MSISSKLRRNKDILQPIVMVTMFIKTFSRTSPTSIIFSRCRDPGRKVVKQYPTATVQFTCLQQSMQMLTIKKIPIHGTHNTIQHIASTMTVRVIISNLPHVSFVAQVKYLLLHNSFQFFLSPCPQVTNSLRKAAPIRSMIGMPNLLRNIRKLSFKMLSTVTNPQPCMKKALQDHNKSTRKSSGLIMSAICTMRLCAIKRPFLLMR